jgi:hypothetical protein
VSATFSWQRENWKRIAQQLESTTLTSSQTIPALAQADISTQAVVREGQIAYAHRQSVIRDDMLKRCRMRWEKCGTALHILEGFDAKVMVEFY